MKKIWNLVGAIVGVIVIIMGIAFIFTPADTFSTESVKDASFGADFYTYEYQATQAAAHNTAVTANNMRELGEKLALYAGMAFVVAGLLITLHFLKEMTSEPKAAPQAVLVQPGVVPVQPVSTPVQPVQTVPQTVAVQPAQPVQKAPQAPAAPANDQLPEH